MVARLQALLPLPMRRWLNHSPLARVLLFLVLCLGIALGVASDHPQVQAQTPAPQGGQAIPNPQQFRALEQPENPLSFQRGEQLSAQAETAIQAQNWDEAARLLSEAFNAYNERSNFHQEIGNVFSGIENRITEEQRNLARDAAQRRDEVAFELAVVYRAAGRSEDAVAQLVTVLSSQGPSRELGLKAYQQLFEIGFVTTPYPS